jgi:ABC-type glycerol-3-phosphate transport system substrate-binding protein
MTWSKTYVAGSFDDKQMVCLFIHKTGGVDCMMKRITAIVVVIFMIMTVLAACQNTQTTTTKSQSTTTTRQTSSTNKEEPKINRFGWEIPDETIEITYYGGYGNPDKLKANSQHMVDFFLEEFNVKINKIVYEVDATERLNMMLTANDYPDVIAYVNVNQTKIFTQQGRALDISDLVDEYGPNIKTQLDDLYVRYFEEDGSLYALPVMWGLLPIPDYSASVRYDYWQSIGSPEFETPYDFYEVLLQMQEKFPENDRGERTFALTDYGGGARMWMSLTGSYGFKDQYRENSDNSLTHWINTDEGLEIVKFVNKIYRDNQIDPDFLIHDFNTMKERVSSHRNMGYIGTWWPMWTAGHMVWQHTEDDWEFNRRFINVKLKFEDAEAAYLSPKDLTGSYRSFITDKCTKPEDVIKWWNFEITDIGTKVIAWGIPDSEYSDWLYVNGTSVWKDYVLDDFAKGSFDLTNYDEGKVGRQFPMIMGQHIMKDGDPRCEGWVNQWFDQNFNAVDPSRKIMHVNLKDTWFDNSYRAVAFEPDNPLTVVNQQVTDALLTGWAKVVTASSEAECEAEYYKLKISLNNLGLGDLEQFRTEEFRNKLEKWK